MEIGEANGTRDGLTADCLKMPGCGREINLAGGWIFQNVIAILISVAGNWLQIHTKKG